MAWSTPSRLTLPGPDRPHPWPSGSSSTTARGAEAARLAAMLLASVDGVIGSSDEARIPVTDEGLTRGDGAFEVMRLYQGRPFALDDHLARLHRTCAGLRLPVDHDTVVGELQALLHAAGPADALL